VKILEVFHLPNLRVFDDGCKRNRSQIQTIYSAGPQFMEGIEIENAELRQVRLLVFLLDFSVGKELVVKSGLQ